MLKKIKFSQYLIERSFFLIATIFVPLDGVFSGAYSPDSSENFINRVVMSIIGFLFLCASFNKIAQKHIKTLAIIIIYAFVVQISYLNFVYSFNVNHALLFMASFLICGFYFETRKMILIYILFSFLTISIVSLITPNPLIDPEIFISRMVIAAIAEYALVFSFIWNKQKLIKSKIKLEKKNKLLKELTKLISRDLFGQAHQISNLMKWLNEDTLHGSEDDSMEVITLLTKKTNHLLQKIRNFYFFSGSSKYYEKLHWFKLKSIFHELESFFLPAKISFSKDLEELLIYSNEALLKNILIELIYKFFQYKQHQKCEIFISSKIDGDFCHFELNYNSSNVPIELKNNIFEFDKVKMSEEIDFSLISVTKIVNDKGGTIHVKGLDQVVIRWPIKEKKRSSDVFFSGIE